MTTNQMVQSLSALEKGTGKSKQVRRSRYVMDPPGIHVYSYNCNEWLYKKADCPFPTMARGLFVRNLNEGPASDKDKKRTDDDDRNGNWEIVIRGYDKFFNVNEVQATTWSWLQANTTAPYEVTTKENGCIIFMSAVKGHLLVTSKHATGPARSADAKSHAQVGEEWMDRHLASVGKSRAELAAFFEQHHVTAVFELGDDDFEEHILEYPPERRGLFLHGINQNTPEFASWPSAELVPFAEKFGFLSVKTLLMDNIQQVKEFTDALRASGSYDGRAIEGFVVRSHLKLNPTRAHFFKVKYDEPYLMFREWREGTKSILREKGNHFVPKYTLSKQYFAWVERKRRQDPGMFAGYTDNKGIINVRNAFLTEYHLPGVGAGIVSEASNTTEEYKRGENTYKGEEEGAAGLVDGFEASGLRAAPSGSDVDMVGAGRRPGGYGSDKTLLVPIATIGAGKTTLGLIMGQLYGISHVQNDNITAKKNGAAVFVSTVMKEFDNHLVVYADKNNHLHEHRKGITEAFRYRYPGGRIIALDWKIAPENADDVAKVAIARVDARGENHQSLTPKKTSRYKAVIHNFTRNRDPLDVDHPDDAAIDDIVDMKMEDDIRVNLIKVCGVMGWEPPTEEAYQTALDVALQTPITVHKVVSNSASSSKASPKPSKNNSKDNKPKYYGIRLDGFDVKEFLNPLFEAHPDEASFYNHLVSQNRIKTTPLHVTLAMTKLGAPDTFDERHDRAGALAANIIARGAQHVQVTISSVVWDETKTMALRVTDLPVESVNVHPHATVGTRDDGVKPMVSNEVLAEAFTPEGIRTGRGNTHVLYFDPPFVVDGVVAEFTY
ncbi:hypothetical protein SmJEL517_g01344 [Synchytrium microbalum]|uniref:tRNA ligase n=1 Tax=Synchytrium microbalum TaxID=1806994 RepID=A0A507CBW5_9FUNG|nr:uncharacterized protein SmJEL517_g01344 [Synchytrium microbalum]TPX36659.1 hypothetical protein SmJEL517_g01344 [Synchytrium microbalum]